MPVAHRFRGLFLALVALLMLVTTLAVLPDGSGAAGACDTRVARANEDIDYYTYALTVPGLTSSEKTKVNQLRNVALDVVAACIPTTTTTTQPTTTTTAPTTTTVSTTNTVPSTIGYKAWAGGPAYWSKFSKATARGWTNPSFFPIGVWFESVLSQGDIDKDKDAGLNTYVVLTNSTDFGLIDRNGMSMVIQQTSVAGLAGVVGWFGDDEADMQLGPVDGPPHMQSIENTIRGRNDGRFLMNNYGKGVLFWETDAQAARFVNEYQDVMSADLYWHTDNNAESQWEGGALFGVNRNLTPAETHQSANYGAGVDKIFRLMNRTTSGNFLMPQWGFVEVGCPWSGATSPCIEPDEIRGAVWSSLIHGATGLTYFNHSFGGPCQSQHVLRDPCYVNQRAAVKDTNARIAQLAPVLNTQSLDLVLGAGVDTMVKRYGGQTYVFAQLARNVAGGTRTLTLPSTLCGQVEVLFETRTLPTGCTITDTFADGNAVHIYRVS